jgi:hypothetical protein
MSIPSPYPSPIPPPPPPLPPPPPVLPWQLLLRLRLRLIVRSMIPYLALVIDISNSFTCSATVPHQGGENDTFTYSKGSEKQFPLRAFGVSWIPVSRAELQVLSAQ